MYVVDPLQFTIHLYVYVYYSFPIIIRILLLVVPGCIEGAVQQILFDGFFSKM